MLQFTVSNLQTSEALFEVPSAFGKWEFNQPPWYLQILKSINEKRAMGNTYTPTNMNKLTIECRRS